MQQIAAPCRVQQIAAPCRCRARTLPNSCEGGHEGEPDADARGVEGQFVDFVVTLYEQSIEEEASFALAMINGVGARPAGTHAYE